MGQVSVSPTVTDWIIAIATSLAFVAASLAAYWARKSASAAKGQLTQMHAQTEIARDDATRAGTDADRAHQIALHARLDALAPVVLTRAQWSNPDPFEYATELSLTGAGPNPWQPVRGDRELDPVLRAGRSGSPQERYRFTIEVSFHNYSTIPARIDFGGQGQLELCDWPQGVPLILRPGEERKLSWRRSLTSIQAHHGAQAAPVGFTHMILEFWVRDLGMSVRDEYRLMASVDVFQVDGSRLKVSAQPRRRWVEEWAGPVARIYERLDEARPDAADAS